MNIHHLLKSSKFHQFIRFIFVGGTATVLHYMIYSLLQLSDINYNLAYTIGYGISFIFNFLASNYYTFKTNPSTGRIVRFAIAHGFNYGLQMSLLNLFIYFGIDKSLAPVFVYMITIPSSFIFVKYALKNK
jgi:putative flippase GtrA